MKTRLATVLIATVVAGVGGVIATAARSVAGADGDPLGNTTAPSEITQDLGSGERLLLVVGGAFPTRQDAEAANRGVSFGDLQGYYVASVDQFVGLREVLGQDEASHVLVTAFRTERGAAEFMGLSRAVGAPALLTPRLQNLGFEYVGLGQEPAPDGSGPLTEPIPGVTIP